MKCDQQWKHQAFLIPVLQTMHVIDNKDYKATNIVQQRNASTYIDQATNYNLTELLEQSRTLTWSDLFIKGDIRPLVKLKNKKQII